MNNSGSNADNITTPTTGVYSGQDYVDKHNTEVKRNKTVNAAINTKKRQYRKITPETVARFQALKALHGNGTQAVRDLEPETRDASRKAFLIASKAKQLNASEYVTAKVEQIAIEAIDRLGELVQSPDESIATKNVHYAIDRQAGKAIQRSESKTLVLNIDAILG